MRTLIVALAALIAAPASAAEWPAPGEGFYLSVQTPPKAGRVRFAYLRATPDPARRGEWSVTVECGVLQAGTGRSVERLTGKGRAERGRMRAIGGTLDLAGRDGGSFIFGLPAEGSLNVKVQFTDGRCPSGQGELSSGD